MEQELQEPSKADIEAIFDSQEFLNLVSDEIRKIKGKRNSRPVPPKGYKYKRTAIDQMIHYEQLTTDFFKTHAKSVLLKKSNLSSRVRDIVFCVCYDAFEKCVIKLNENI